MSVTTMSANKHKLAWSKLRTDIDLITRNKIYSKRETNRLLYDIYKELDKHDSEAYRGRLEYKTVIYPPISIKAIEKVGFIDKMSYKKKRMLMGLPNDQSKLVDKDSPLGRLNKMLKNGSAASRKSSWNFRLGEACKEYIDWHPFFITLTVDPKLISPLKLWKDSNEWQKYIKSIAKVSMQEGGLNNKTRKIISVRNYLQYAALLEHGKSGEHHHIHCLMFIKYVPESWKVDPNASMSSKMSIHRRCLFLESYWKWSGPGLSPCIYFRFIGDIWTRYGHKVPVKDRKSLKLTPPDYAGGYLLKYMDKSEERAWHHRIKSTQSIGMNKLRQQISRLNMDQLNQLLIRPPSHELNLLQKTILTVPIGLMKYVTKSVIYKTTYMKMKFRELIEPKPKPYLNMLRSVKNGKTPWRYNSRELYTWLLDVIPPAKIEFCESLWLQSLSLLNFNRNNLNVTNTIGAL